MSTILYCIILGHPTGTVKPYYIVLYWATQLGQWNHIILYYIGPPNWGSETILYCIIMGHPTGAVKPYYIVLYWAIQLGQWNHFILYNIGPSNWGSETILYCIILGHPPGAVKPFFIDFNYVKISLYRVYVCYQVGQMTVLIQINL